MTYQIAKFAIMKTQLPKHIKTKEEAEKFLTDLYNNDEAYDPEGDAHYVDWKGTRVSNRQCNHLNRLMEEIDRIEGFNARRFITKLTSVEYVNKLQAQKN